MGVHRRGVVRMRRRARARVREVDSQVHVVVVGCGRVGSGLARAVEAAGPHGGHHRSPGEGLPPPARGVLGPQGGRRRLRPRPPRGGRHRARPGPSPPSPTATTPTSSSPGSPGRPTASRRSSPASTTPAAPPSTSGSASPPSPPCSGPPSGSCAASSPTAGDVEWIDPSAKVVLVERLGACRPGRPQGRASSRTEARPGRSPCPASACRSCPRPSLVLQEGDVLYLAVARRRASTTLDAHLAGGGREGGH